MWQEGEEGKISGAAQNEKKVEEQLNLGKLVPTRPVLLDPTNLEKLEPLFKEGRQGELDPIVIIHDPDTDELLLEDGNNRTALAMKYGVQIPYKIYEVGDTHTDSVGSFVIDKGLLALNRKFRAKAKERGFNNFQEYYEMSMRQKPQP